MNKSDKKNKNISFVSYNFYCLQRVLTLDHRQKK